MNYTEEQRLQHWKYTYNFLLRFGWKHVNGFQFQSPFGNIHDMSAADLNQHERIAQEKLFLVN